jgi:amidase
VRNHRLTRDQVIYHFGPDLTPVLTVEPGDRVTFETLDSWSGRLRRPEDIDTVPMDPALANPATGPVAIRGAEPGDALAVRVEDIRLISPGLAKIVPSGGILAGEVRSPVLHFVAIESGPTGEEVVFPAAFGNVRFPTRPMIGVIGTAPAGESVANLYPGDHGGNLDVGIIGPGATVYLPVRIPGGLVALGDCHATMGDGELSGAGIDIRTDTTVTIDLVKGLHLPRPRVETADAWVTIGQAPTLQEAVKIACRDMVDLLSERLQIGREEALILVSARGDARIGQSAAMGVNAIAYIVFPWVPGAG